MPFVTAAELGPSESVTVCIEETDKGKISINSSN